MAAFGLATLRTARTGWECLPCSDQRQCCLKRCCSLISGLYLLILAKPRWAEPLAFRERKPTRHEA
jgi:hypothetical protein